MKIKPRFHFYHLRIRLPLAMFMFLFALVQACEQEGCSGLETIPGGFPEDKKLQNAVQIRLAEEGIDFIEQELLGLVGASLEDGMTFDVPPVCEGGTKICCETPDPECKLDLQMNGLSLTPKVPDGLGFALRTELVTRSKSGPYLPVTATIIGIELQCDAMIDTTRAGRPDVEIGGKIRFSVDPRTNKTRLTLQNVAMSYFDDNDLVLSGGAGCTIANWLKTFFIDTVLEQFSTALDDTVEKQLCVTCEGTLPLEEECGSLANSCQNGYCMANNRCMQVLGIEGRLDLQEALAELVDGLEGAIDVYAVASNYAQVSGQSVSLGVAGGAWPASPAKNSCVPTSPPRAWTPSNALQSSTGRRIPR